MHETSALLYPDNHDGIGSSSCHPGRCWKCGAHDRPITGRIRQVLRLRARARIPPLVVRADERRRDFFELGVCVRPDSVLPSGSALRSCTAPAARNGREDKDCGRTHPRGDRRLHLVACLGSPLFGPATLPTSEWRCRRRFRQASSGRPGNQPSRCWLMHNRSVPFSATLSACSGQRRPNCQCG